MRRRGVIENEKGKVSMPDIHRLVTEQKNRIIESRRDLHRIPETAYTEKKTSAYVADALCAEGLDVHTGIAEYGVVGLLETKRPGPTVLIRSDMDALPLTEETGLDFSSTHPGAMHACGHDAHMAMLLGAAKLLTGIKDRLSGNIKFLFQPAEMAHEGVFINNVPCFVDKDAVQTDSSGVYPGMKFIGNILRFTVCTMHCFIYDRFRHLSKII